MKVSRELKLVLRTKLAERQKQIVETKFKSLKIKHEKNRKDIIKLSENIKKLEKEKERVKRLIRKDGLDIDYYYDNELEVKRSYTEKGYEYNIKSFNLEEELVKVIYELQYSDDDKSSLDRMFAKIKTLGE